jgi:hypothetical protein
MDQSAKLINTALAHIMKPIDDDSRTHTHQSGTRVAFASLRARVGCATSGLFPRA